MSGISSNQAISVALPHGISSDHALLAVQDAEAMAPFAPTLVHFVRDFSDAILKKPEFRKYPETIAFGYWIRNARLNEMKKAFFDKANSGLLTARGVAFHIAPSNVDTIFLYSLIISLLVGNRNIVRVSIKDSHLACCRFRGHPV
jgi:hypothetical protein